MIPSTFDYVRVQTVKEAIDKLNELNGDGKLIAGGQSLIPLLKFRLSEPTSLVDIRHISELKDICIVGNRLVVGALATHAEVTKDATVNEYVPVLAETCEQIADIQIRNVGTIGGNIAHADPAADLPATATALDAIITYEDENGEESVPLEDFVLGPLITTLPPTGIVKTVSFEIPPSHAKGIYLKNPHPASGYPVIGVTAVGGVDHEGKIDYIRIGITGVGDMAFRAKATEDKLIGQPVNSALLKEAASLAAEGRELGSDHFTSAEYREQLCKVYTERALKAIFE